MAERRTNNKEGDNALCGETFPYGAKPEPGAISRFDAIRKRGWSQYKHSLDPLMSAKVAAML